MDNIEELKELRKLINKVDDEELKDQMISLVDDIEEKNIYVVIGFYVEGWPLIMDINLNEEELTKEKYVLTYIIDYPDIYLPCYKIKEYCLHDCVSPDEGFDLDDDDKMFINYFNTELSDSLGFRNLNYNFFKKYFEKLESMKLIDKTVIKELLLCLDADYFNMLTYRSQHIITSEDYRKIINYLHEKLYFNTIPKILDIFNKNIRKIIEDYYYEY